MRELEAAEEHDIPIVAVHETDVRRGGATLDALEKACPEQYRRLIFGRPERIITWHRQREFQLFALSRIGERLVLACPTNAQQTELPLRVPGALAWERPLFDAPLSLYKSAENHEVDHVFTDLCDHYADGRISRSSIMLAEGATASASRWRHLETYKHTRSWGWVLFLSNSTFVDEAGLKLAEEIHTAMIYGIRPVLVYSSDGDAEFQDIISASPQKLVQAGLFKKLAIEYLAEPHRTISIRLIAKALGAQLGGHACSSWVRARSVFLQARMRVSFAHATLSRKGSHSNPTVIEEGASKTLVSSAGTLIVPPSARLGSGRLRENAANVHNAL